MRWHFLILGVVYSQTAGKEKFSWNTRSLMCKFCALDKPVLSVESCRKRPYCIIYGLVETNSHYPFWQVSCSVQFQKIPKIDVQGVTSLYNSADSVISYEYYKIQNKSFFKVSSLLTQSWQLYLLLSNSKQIEMLTRYHNVKH